MYLSTFNRPFVYEKQFDKFNIKKMVSSVNYLAGVPYDIKLTW